VKRFSALLVALIGCGDPPTPPPKPAPPPPVRAPEPPKTYEVGGVRINKLNSGSDVAREWNQLVDMIWMQPGKEFKARHFETAQQLLERARGTPDYAPLKDNFDQMLKRMAGRASEEFAATRVRAEALCAEHRYSQAWEAWDLYPSKLDEAGTFTAMIPAEQAAIVERARVYVEQLPDASLLDGLRVGRAGKQLEALDAAVRARLDALDRAEEEKLAERDRTLMQEAARTMTGEPDPRAHFEADRFAAAMVDLEKLFKQDRIGAETVALMNRICERSAYIGVAIKIYQEALTRLPENGDLYVGLLRLMLRTHQYARAHALIDAAPRRMVHPDFAKLIHTLQRAERAFAGRQPPGYPFKRYVVITDLDEARTREIAEFMDGLYREYAQLFPYAKNETLKFYVKVFAKEIDFRTYYAAKTGGSELGKSYRVGGFYDGEIKELVLYDGETMRRTMRHEGFHQYVDYFVTDCPPWFNEGYASYFETSTASKPVNNPERAAAAREGIAREFVPPLRETLTMKESPWRSHTYSAHLYAQAWSFIYHLETTGRGELLKKYFEELMRGRKPDIEPLAALEESWRRSVTE
jgi:tetratricopeptide (TPR) repeat protein